MLQLGFRTRPLPSSAIMKLLRNVALCAFFVPAAIVAGCGDEGGIPGNAVAEVDGPLAGLAATAGCAALGHRYDAVRAELLARAGLAAEAVLAYDAALAACGNETERAHLAHRRRQVGRGAVPR